METPPNEDGKKRIRDKIFYGRDPGPLLGPWIACLVIVGAVFFLETKMPVFHEVVQILYFIVGVVLVIATARWFRAREGNRRHGDRRNADRRQP
jgi:hypothetical protein